MAGQLSAPAPFTSVLLPDGLGAVPFAVEDERGRSVLGWQVPAASDAPRGVVVLLHGVRGNRTTMVRRARFLAEAGYASVIIDLHAHGESDGERITMGDQERFSAQAAVRYARDAFPTLPVAVIGVSLGGAAAALASPLGVDAMVLESVYPDIESAIKHRVSAKLGAFGALPSWLLLAQIEPRLGVARGSLRPVDRVGQVDCPLMLISGAVDPHTPAAEAERLFEAAAEPKELWLVPGAAHVDLHAAAEPEYETRVLAFLEQAMPLPALILKLYVAFSFDANGEADWEALRGHFAEGATFVSPVPPGKTPKGVNAETFLAEFQGFIRSSPLGKSGYHERVIHTRIEELGAVAHAWVTFEAFVPGEAVDRRGVDSLQFVRDADDWKLVSFTTQYETDDLSLPQRFLPQPRLRARSR